MRNEAYSYVGLHVNSYCTCLSIDFTLALVAYMYMYMTCMPPCLAIPTLIDTNLIDSGCLKSSKYNLTLDLTTCTCSDLWMKRTRGHALRLNCTSTFYIGTGDDVSELS